MNVFAVKVSASQSIALVLGLFLAGCATAQRDVATHYDPISGERTDVLNDNFLESPTDPPREEVMLNAAKVFNQGGRYSYYLEVYYQALEEAGYLDIPPGNTLTLVVDGREMAFGGLGSVNSREVKYGTVLEMAIYETSAYALRTVASAKSVTVKIRGANGLIVREFKPQNFDKYRAFVEQFVNTSAR